LSYLVSLIFKALSTLATTVAEVGDYSRQCGQGLRLTDGICFYRAMLAQSAVMRLHVVCLSVCPSVCLSVTMRYRVQIGWNSSKLISRPNSLRLCSGWHQHGRSGATGTPPKLGL